MRSASDRTGFFFREEEERRDGTNFFLSPADFEPFDLESWWGKKLYKNLTQVN